MSNYHYNDLTTCKSCSNRADYSSLGNTTHYDCDQYCLCRDTRERSDKDRMYYDFYVLNKPMNLQPYQQSNINKNNSGNINSVNYNIN